MATNSLELRLIHTQGSGRTRELQWSSSQTAGSETIIDESVANGTTAQQVAFTADLSQLKMVVFWTTVAMTLYTNGEPASEQESFTLEAGKPVWWESGDAAIFAGDITTLYITNSSGADGVLNLMSLEDPTV